MTLEGTKQCQVGHSCMYSCNYSCIYQASTAVLGNLWLTVKLGCLSYSRYLGSLKSGSHGQHKAQENLTPFGNHFVRVHHHPWALGNDRGWGPGKYHGVQPVSPRAAASTASFSSYL